MHMWLFESYCASIILLTCVYEFTHSFAALYTGKFIFIINLGMDDVSKPQMLLFSATVPEWVNDTARRFMKTDRQRVDLVGKNSIRTAIGVEVRAASVHVYQCVCVLVCIHRELHY